MFVVRAGITLARSTLTKTAGSPPGSGFRFGSVPGHHCHLCALALLPLTTLGPFWAFPSGIWPSSPAVFPWGLGFGLQNIVNNFIGGLILLFGRSIQPGDLVEIDNIRGHVRKVTIRNTLVKAFSGATIFCPPIPS